eukprot:CAMPEP_0118703662 /NCGR_PEP_ID=MMETSP0800-20121206/18708_1 /TAXON_ID=210618 ORGANISM="Striatella unipunctata, Strain CCMP2910" /NCGR_SAMPLE_ID=MMETSP0800 /ASSEMBLY_ACC=CAM_ASM_000638 /LENGTH=558 /DNA_ID=CAMNT_0006605273 /DNA_START=170 /DNA_END=1846 /DNA_ORIENTATION=+
MHSGRSLFGGILLYLCIVCKVIVAIDGPKFVLKSSSSSISRRNSRENNWKSQVTFRGGSNPNPVVVQQSSSFFRLGWIRLATSGESTTTLESGDVSRNDLQGSIMMELLNEQKFFSCVNSTGFVVAASAMIGGGNQDDVVWVGRPQSSIDFKWDQDIRVLAYLCRVVVIRISGSRFTQDTISNIKALQLPTKLIFLVDDDDDETNSVYENTEKIMFVSSISELRNVLQVESKRHVNNHLDDFPIDAIGLLANRIYQKMCSTNSDDDSQHFQYKPRKAPTRDDVSEDAPRNDDIPVQEWQEIILQEAQDQLAKLEQKQQDVWLDESTEIPISEFGQDVNGILEQASTKWNQSVGSLSEVTSENMQFLKSKYNVNHHELGHEKLIQVRDTEKKEELLVKLASDAHRLFDQQLQSLREYYGRRYETVLDAHSNDEKKWKAAATSSLQGFQKAARSAIPPIFRENPIFDKKTIKQLYDAKPVLMGLLKDMAEAKSSRTQDNEADFDDDDSGLGSRQYPKWMKKVGAQAIMLGFNYLQGWLAWQGVRRAAIERDKKYPKFPLF